MVLANGQLAFYRTPGTKSGISVRLEGETVWLTLDQMAALFQRDKSVISRHLRNVYQNGELDRKATVAKTATVQQEGRRRVERLMESDNLDAVISVGYRVNLTTEANELVATIYDRMPVILRPEDEDQWLDPGADLAALKRMLVPYAGRELHAYPVSPLVNSPRNDTPECLEPVAS